MNKCQKKKEWEKPRPQLSKKRAKAHKKQARDFSKTMEEGPTDRGLAAPEDFPTDEEFLRM